MFNRNRSNLKKINKIVNKILALKTEFEKLTDEELKKKTVIFKERIKNGEMLDSILPEAFATVREASRRTIGLEHFPVQLIGGIALHNGLIAEMKTGEGKTLVSTCPAYLNALTGKPVHIVTVNDYLAKRDSEFMGQVHEFLGLTVGVVLSQMSQVERKQEYACDITYVTNNELGFDYLRDNMATKREEQVLRGLDFCIIDEVDSVLIDEARTPLIICGQSEKSTSLYLAADFIAKKLEQGEFKELSKMNFIMGEDIEESGDFIVDEKDKQTHLTEPGIKKVEEFFHIENLADPNNIDIQHHINLALKANYLMYKDKDYVVKEENILIIDEFTGRIMEGRRYSDGLHQAIEAKEKVDIRKESRTFATITFQNFFNKFIKKSGMTGTAKTEEKEFKSIYNMSVLEIPTNKPVMRKDYDDAVFKTRREKFEAVVREVKKPYEKGQPVLVGTIAIETSECLSKMLKKEHIPHKVLNAKYVEQEAEIIEKAGQYRAITIATNMAGRGTDIKLDEDAKKAGGLRIIGTERHESRRIDNQLRGRSGRQGDPGESKFYLSLEDDLMRLFGSDKMIPVFEKVGVEEGDEIYHKMLSKSIENAQTKIEHNNFGIREQLLKFDEINNEQRELIYAERDQILDNENLKILILEMMDSVVEEIVNKNDTSKEENLKDLIIEIHQMIPMKINKDELTKINKKELVSKLEQDVRTFYSEFEKQFDNEEIVRGLERNVLLRIIDQKWMDHIDNLEKLRESINLQAYGQREPLTEYKIEAYNMFREMIHEIKKSTVRFISHIKVEKTNENGKEN